MQKIIIDGDVIILERTEHTSVMRIIGYYSSRSNAVKQTKPGYVHFSSVRVKHLNGAVIGTIGALEWKVFGKSLYEKLPKRVKKYQENEQH